VDQSSHEFAGRVPAELGAQQVDHPGALGGVTHRLRLDPVGGEGLLAQDVLPGLRGAQDQIVVGVRRRRDRDGIHVVEGERLVDVDERFETEARRPGPSLLGITTDQGTHLEPGRSERGHMGQAPEAGPDHRHSGFGRLGHRRPPRHPTSGRGAR
jgi:hypothetical protein